MIIELSPFAGYPFGRHHPRKPMIVYSVAFVISRGFPAYWMPAFAGMTNVFSGHTSHGSHAQ
jgi:hypothetical protein